ncbi:hypothetical protein V8E36_003219 [Tilletia maclaganii]
MNDLASILHQLHVLRDPLDRHRRDCSAEELEVISREDRLRWVNEPDRLQIAVMASNLKAALQEPLVSVVHIPENFQRHVEDKELLGTGNFLPVTKPGAPPHDNMPSYVRDSEWHLEQLRPDKEFRLLYWQQGGYGRIDWALVDQAQDEATAIIRAFRRACRDTFSSAEMRYGTARHHLHRRLVRPTNWAEKDAFRHWAQKQADVDMGGLWYDFGATTFVPREVIFDRFEMNPDRFAELCDEIHEAPFWEELDHEDNPGGFHPFVPTDVDLTAEPTSTTQFLQQVRVFKAAPAWQQWLHQRLPPAWMLPELERIARKRKRADEDLDQPEE